MAKPPEQDYKPPAFNSLRWDVVSAAGQLSCDTIPCAERGVWYGIADGPAFSIPYFLSGRPLRQAARAWYQARVARMKREQIRFFEGVAIINPQQQQTEKPSPDRPLRKVRKRQRAAR